MDTDGTRMEFRFGGENEAAQVLHLSVACRLAFKLVAFPHPCLIRVHPWQNPNPSFRLSFPRPASRYRRVQQEDVWFNYRFCVEQVRVGGKRRFQLRVGLAGDPDCELIPVHRSAFAKRLRLKTTHAAEAGAQSDFTALIAWLNTRYSARIMAHLGSV